MYARFWVSAISAIAITASAAGSDTLVFMNGDRLAGRLLDSRGSQSLHWQVAEGSPVVEVPVEVVHRVVLGRGEWTAPNHELSVMLENGDVLQGILSGLDDDAVHLESSWFGGAALPRKMVSVMSINTGGYFVLPDPGEPEDWRSNRSDAWRLSDGELVSSDFGTFSRDMPFAERIRIAFDVVGASASSGLTVQFFVANPEQPNSDNHYAIQLTGTFAYARKTSRPLPDEDNENPRPNTEPVGQPQSFDRRVHTGAMSVVILANLRSGEIILEIDGEEVASWVDPRGFPGETGNGIAFSNNSQSRIAIRNFNVSRWGGAVDEDDGVGLADDVVVTRNDDRFEGRITEMAGEVIELEAEGFGPLSLPSERVISVRLASETRERPRRLQGDVEVSLRDGGRLTVRLDSLEEGHLAGYSESGGEWRIDRTGISEILFNVYEEKFDDPDRARIGRPEFLLSPDW